MEEEGAKSSHGQSQGNFTASSTSDPLGTSVSQGDILARTRVSAAVTVTGACFLCSSATPCSSWGLQLVSCCLCSTLRHRDPSRDPGHPCRRLWCWN